MTAQRRAQVGDEGFGLTETLISIVLFGLIAVAIIPALIVGITISGQTTTKATANAVALAQIEKVRAQVGISTDCAQFHAILDQPIDNYEDARGAFFTVNQTTSVEAICDDSLDFNVIEFTVDVQSSSIDAPEAAKVTTQIAVPRVI